MLEEDSEVKWRTGFQSLRHMLAYIVVVCNADDDKITYTDTSLTWLEEWFFYFEFLWGRTICRWVDAEAVFKIHSDKLRAIFKSKLKLVNLCRDRWPRYASYLEDFSLMKEKWATKYNEIRAIMWDDTNVNFAFKPSGAEAQKNSFSAYYGGNCAKGGVFLQLCGWMGVEHLWAGRTSDSHYQEKTNIFGKQHLFALNDRINGKHIPFTNILDKGYRVNLAAWRAGKQQVLQPTFARSDRKFTGRETIISADIAADRSGNERAVNRSKESGFIKRGLLQNSSPVLMDDVWLAWSFQTNFMFKLVL